MREAGPVTRRSGAVVSRVAAPPLRRDWPPPARRAGVCCWQRCWDRPWQGTRRRGRSGGRPSSRWIRRRNRRTRRGEASAPNRDWPGSCCSPRTWKPSPRGAGGAADDIRGRRMPGSCIPPTHTSDREQSYAERDLQALRTTRYPWFRFPYRLGHAGSGRPAKRAGNRSGAPGHDWRHRAEDTGTSAPLSGQAAAEVAGSCSRCDRPASTWATEVDIACRKSPSTS
jgi:hypothetical protein